jgi:hypothetical protein
LGGSAGSVIALANRDAVCYPSQFVVPDGRGKLKGEYWHSGHLDSMAFADLDGNGTKEMLSGVGRGGASGTFAG